MDLKTPMNNGQSFLALQDDGELTPIPNDLSKFTTNCNLTNAPKKSVSNISRIYGYSDKYCVNKILIRRNLPPIPKLDLR